MRVYLLETFGDLDRRFEAFGDFGDALQEVKDCYGHPDNWPDMEDDRIVIWEATPGEVVTCVWHFSGWHWDGEAADLPGGPQLQGCLPGDSMPLYDRCTEEQM